MLSEAPSLRYDDPLRESTRKERRSLLIVSFIGLLVSRVGLLPSKIEAFGAEFPSVDQRWLLFTCAALIVYFLLGFTIYAITDWFAHEAESYRVWRKQDRPAWRMLREIIQEEREHRGPLDKLTEPVRRKRLERYVRITLMSIRFRPVRFVFDFILPLVVGSVSLVFVMVQAFAP